jgi:hypothetical protein
MPRALLRKLTDVTTGEQLASLQARLNAERIPSEFQIHKRKEYDFFRVYVYLGHLQKAKAILGGGR